MWFPLSTCAIWGFVPSPRLFLSRTSDLNVSCIALSWPSLATLPCIYQWLVATFNPYHLISWCFPLVLSCVAECVSQKQPASLWTSWKLCWRLLQGNFPFGMKYGRQGSCVSFVLQGWKKSSCWLWEMGRSLRHPIDRELRFHGLWINTRMPARAEGTASEVCPTLNLSYRSFLFSKGRFCRHR